MVGQGNLIHTVVSNIVQAARDKIRNLRNSAGKSLTAIKSDISAKVSDLQPLCPHNS